MEKTLESLANTLAEDDRDQFLDFVQCLLCWLPEQRLPAGQAYYHPWLRKTSWRAGSSVPLRRVFIVRKGLGKMSNVYSRL